MKAFETGEYRNLFKLIGKSDEEISERINSIWNTFFYGSEEERIYHPVDPDMGYLEDTGNLDARTEGMSYGMMIAVQTNHKEEFDRIWKWACTYMWNHEGKEEGYFAWSCAPNGKKNAIGAAPDGEEFFAMSLFFASHRWGDGEGIYEYSKHAKEILKACLHKGEKGRAGHPMWNHDNKQILFIAGADYTDPSYHLPHFYELFGRWCYEEDREFFREAAEASRCYLAKACHPVTGMSPEYGEFDGSPIQIAKRQPWRRGRHDRFYSDAYRTAANIGLDAEWFGIDRGQYEADSKLLKFFDERGVENLSAVYEVDGTALNEPALHPVGLLATTVQGVLAVLNGNESEQMHEIALKWLEILWNTPLREGNRRYYDNCLYFFAFLALSGNYRIW